MILCLSVEIDFQLIVFKEILTTADIDVTEDATFLSNQSRRLKLNNLSHPQIRPVIVSLDPPPLELDRKIDGLKRIEFRFPAEEFENGSGVIRIRLSGE